MKDGLIIDNSMEMLSLYKNITNSIFPEVEFFTATNVTEALEIIKIKEVDTIIYSNNDVNQDYLCNILRLKSHSANTILVSIMNSDKKSIINKIFNNGADGCILLNEPDIDLTRLLRVLTYDIAPVSPNIVKILTNEQPNKKFANSIKLTNRENDVFDLLCKGLSNKAIALSLNLSIHTIADYVKSILKKMGVHHRTELIKQYLNIY